MVSRETPAFRAISERVVPLLEHAASINRLIGWDFMSDFSGKHQSCGVSHLCDMVAGKLTMGIHRGASLLITLDSRNQSGPRDSFPGNSKVKAGKYGTAWESSVCIGHILGKEINALS